jgi:hypothetical protein
MSMTVILKQMPPQVLAEDIRGSGSLGEFLAKFELFRDAQEVKNPEQWETELGKYLKERCIEIIKSNIDAALTIISIQALSSSAQVPLLDLDCLDIILF